MLIYLDVEEYLIILVQNLELMNIVILTGAGISAESGLGTFRSSGGLWEKFKIEDVATPMAWKKNTELVLNFYNERRKQCLAAKPNKAHLALAELAKHYAVSIITQNIDDLHERAGSNNITHLHGEILKAKSSELTNDYYHIENDIRLGDKCDNGKQLRPHVVWFGEAVPEMDKAEQISLTADIFIVIGTSLNVYPAANLINRTKENCSLIVIDPNELKVKNSGARLIKENATIGVPLLVEELIAKKKRD